MGIFNIGRSEEEKEFLRDVKESKGYQPKSKQRNTSRIQQTGFELGRQVGGFTQVPQEDFSFQEQVLRETVGGRGEKIWGTIGKPVTMNHDLNPRQRGDESTGALFGF